MLNKSIIYLKYDFLCLSNTDYQIIWNVLRPHCTGIWVGYKKFNEELGNHIFLTYKLNPITSNVILSLKNKYWYESHLTLEDTIILIVKCHVDNLVKNLLAGKYSKMYPKYILDKIPKEKVQHSYEVLTRDPELIARLAFTFDVSEEYITELDEIPQLSKEIYDYQATSDSEMETTQTRHYTSN